MEGPEPAAEVHVNVSLSGAVETRKNVCPGAALKQVGMPQMCACEQKIAKWGLALCGKGMCACTHEHGSTNAHYQVLGPSAPSMRNQLDRIISIHVTCSDDWTVACLCMSFHFGTFLTGKTSVLGKLRAGQLPRQTVLMLYPKRMVPKAVRSWEWVAWIPIILSSQFLIEGVEGPSTW
jgi:hypothetical protein